MSKLRHCQRMHILHPSLAPCFSTVQIQQSTQKWCSREDDAVICSWSSNWQQTWTCDFGTGQQAASQRSLTDRSIR